MTDITIYSKAIKIPKNKEITITKEMDEIIKVFEKWGITYAYSDNDLLDICQEILDGLSKIKNVNPLT